MFDDIDACVFKSQTLLKQLLSSPPVQIESAIQERSDPFTGMGIYAFSMPDNPPEIIYIGRTITKSIQSRIKDHVNLKTPFDLRGMLERDPSVPQEVHAYHVRFLIINDPLERARMEYFAISILSPRFNKFNL